MTDIRKSEDRLASISLTPCHSRDGSSGRNSRLSRITYAVFPDPFQDFIPIQCQTSPIALIGNQRLRWRPDQFLEVINTALDGWKGAALACQCHTCPHGMVPHKFHHLGTE